MREKTRKPNGRPNIQNKKQVTNKHPKRERTRLVGSDCSGLGHAQSRSSAAVQAAPNDAGHDLPSKLLFLKNVGVEVEEGEMDSDSESGTSTPPVALDSDVWAVLNGQSYEELLAMKKCVLRIAEELTEYNIPLLERAVIACGTDKACSLLDETQRLVTSGGLLTGGGERPRSPGGIFLFLLKESVEPEMKQLIWKQQSRQQNARKRERRKRDEQRSKSSDGKVLKNSVMQSELRTVRFLTEPPTASKRRKQGTPEEASADVAIHDDGGNTRAAGDNPAAGNTPAADAGDTRGAAGDARGGGAGDGDVRREVFRQWM
eukprot:Lankesteria_metandrocarpae@DN5271_c2_g1_i3.p1